MCLTLLFIVLSFYKKNKCANILEKVDDEPELFEFDNILNYSHNPEYYDNYWNKIHNELFYLFAKSFIILLCMYLDITCIKYVYLSE
jgi:hypothetical protein